MRVVDGDTIVIAPDRVVRLIGVDTPETVKPEHPVEPFGPEAAAFTRQFLAGGTARLSFDRERVDRFGRFLAYVWDESKLDAGAGAGLDRVEREDEAIVEAVQRGLRSRFYDRGRYSPSREQGTHHFHRMLACCLGGRD